MKSVEECAHKANCAFFALGSIGAFHGRLNPLSCCSHCETFVVPIMLYGCKTWILSKSHLHPLKSFQAEIGKHILGISKYHSNTGTLMGLHWPSVKARILICKLTFLPNYWREMIISAHMFLNTQKMFMRSILYSSDAFWSNSLALAIYSYVLKIPHMHAR